MDVSLHVSLFVKIARYDSGKLKVVVVIWKMFKLKKIDRIYLLSVIGRHEPTDWLICQRRTESNICNRKGQAVVNVAG